MGYTHYWRKTGNWTDEQIKATVSDMASIVKRSDMTLGNCMGESNTMPEIEDVFIGFNGTGDDSHETFSFPPDKESENFSFCKTARKPYDQIVVACLLSAKHHLGDAIRLGSDGRWDKEWTDGAGDKTGSGVKLYAYLFPDRRVTNPLERES